MSYLDKLTPDGAKAEIRQLAEMLACGCVLNVAQKSALILHYLQQWLMYDIELNGGDDCGGLYSGVRKASRDNLEKLGFAPPAKVWLNGKLWTITADWRAEATEPN